MQFLWTPRRVPYGGFGFGVYGAMSSDESSEDEEVEEVDNGSDDMDADEAGPPAGLPLAFGKQGVEDSVAEEEKQAKEETKKEKEEADLKQQTMELQWKSYVSNLKKSGTLHSALAICDVSGSMSGQPMEVHLLRSISTPNSESVHCQTLHHTDCAAGQMQCTACLNSPHGSLHVHITRLCTASSFQG